MNAKNILFVGLGLFFVALAAAIFIGAAFFLPAAFESRPARAESGAEATATPTWTSVETAEVICLPTDELIALLNQTHAINPNNVEPVLAWLNALPGAVTIDAGGTIPRAENGFVVFWTTEDIDPTRFSWSREGVVVALMGGGRGTVLAFYDTVVVTPVTGKWLTGWCHRINPQADLSYWGRVVIPTQFVEPTESAVLITPYPTVSNELILGGGRLTNCLPTDELIALLNQTHAINPNNVEPVLAWLNALPGAVTIDAGGTIPRAENGFVVFWTTEDIDPTRFSWSREGVVVALMGGGRGTVLAFYDTVVVTPVTGKWLTGWCHRINPQADLSYWGR